jgi:hypothetical protein
MLGNGRLRYSEPVDELTDRPFAVAEQVEDLKPARLGQDLESGELRHTENIAVELYARQEIKFRPAPRRPVSTRTIGRVLAVCSPAMSETRRTTTDEARRVGDEIGVDWSRFDLEQFRAGMDVEYEHGSHDPQTDVTHDDPVVTGKIALAHMKEFPDYYERLERMEAEAEREWAARRP